SGLDDDIRSLHSAYSTKIDNVCSSTSLAMAGALSGRSPIAVTMFLARTLRNAGRHGTHESSISLCAGSIWNWGAAGGLLYDTEGTACDAIRIQDLQRRAVAAMERRIPRKGSQ